MRGSWKKNASWHCAGRSNRISGRFHRQAWLRLTHFFLDILRLLYTASTSSLGKRSTTLRSRRCSCSRLGSSGLSPTILRAKRHGWNLSWTRGVLTSWQRASVSLAPQILLAVRRKFQERVAVLTWTLPRASLARMIRSVVYQTCGSSCAKISCRVSSVCKLSSSSDALAHCLARSCILHLFLASVSSQHSGFESFTRSL
mmetsp:Transcript_30758/g.49548  ORF Transcript_30758/g.49548 Transcript_30758/m.49548 type:complete len:200 (-) Transcript_30758:254-853(-)